MNSVDWFVWFQAIKATTWRMIQMAGAWQEAMEGRKGRKSHQPKPTVILAALESIDRTIFHLTCGLESKIL